jgi:hypothetical protein
MHRSLVLKLSVLLAMAMLLLAACSSEAPATTQPPVSNEAQPAIATETGEPVVEAETAAAVTQSVPITQAPVDIAPTATSEQAQATAASIKPTPRPDLRATDPTTVSLASGQVQLVEFFAFW